MKKVTAVLLVMIFLSGCQKNEVPIAEETIDVKEAVSEQKEEKIISHIENDKEETVYVSADAYGNPEKTEVEVILKASGSEPIEDISNLYDIRNTASDEEFTEDDLNLVFENKGEDIHYKGLSDQPLPVNVRISYFLNGEQLPAEKIKGQSGHFRILFDYSNSTSVNQDGYNLIQPFMALSTVMLDGEKTANIKVDNGKLLQYGDSSIALIIAAPGISNSLKLSSYELTKELELKDYGEIEFDAIDFSLDYTATILSNNLFADLEDEDLDDLNEFASQSKDFRTDSTELSDNTAKLVDACISLQDGLGAYTGAITTLDTSMATITEGAGQLSDGLSQINEMFKSEEDKKSPVEEIQELLTQLSAGLEEYDKAIDQLETLISDLEEYRDKLDETEKEGYLSKIEECRKQLEIIKEMKVAELLKSCEMIIGKVVLLQSSLQEAAQGSAQLAAGLVKIKEGTSALSSNGCSVNLGAKQLVKAAKEFDEGINSFINDDLDDLLKLGGASLSDVVGRLKAIKKIDQNYGCFSGLKEGQKGKTVFIIETAAIN